MSLTRGSLLDTTLVAAGIAAVVVGTMLIRDTDAASTRSASGAATSMLASSGDTSPNTGVQPPQGTGRTSHTSPTSWGLFIIDPVIDGKNSIDLQEPTVPSFPASSVSSGEGAQAPSMVGARSRRFLDVPPEFRDGLTALGAEAAEDDQGRFRTAVYYLADDGTPQVRSVRLTAYTPTRPVPVLEYPDTAIYDFRASSDVRGFPTITIVPDKGTSDPNGERRVMWSQGNAVYFVATTGTFSDADVLSACRARVRAG